MCDVLGQCRRHQTRRINGHRLIADDRHVSCSDIGWGILLCECAGRREKQEYAQQATIERSYVSGHDSVPLFVKRASRSMSGDSRPGESHTTVPTGPHEAIETLYWS